MKASTTSENDSSRHAAVDIPSSSSSVKEEVVPDTTSEYQMYNADCNTPRRRSNNSAIEESTVQVDTTTTLDDNTTEKDMPFKSKLLRFLKQVQQHEHFYLGMYSAAGLVILITLTYFSFFAATVDGVPPLYVSCRSWDYWTGPDCGTNGINCLPFKSDSPIAIRCPTRCTWDKDPSLTVFGSGPYAANSRICRAAIHSGVIGTAGGCAMYHLDGTQTFYESSTQNGISTLEFPSWFPKSFSFSSVNSSNHCVDLSGWILATGCVHMIGFAFFLKNCASVFTYVIMVMNFYGYWYTALVGQPRTTDYIYIVTTGTSEVFIVLAATYALIAVGPIKAFADIQKSLGNLSTVKILILWTISYVIPFMIALNINVIAYVPWLNIELGGFDNSDTGAVDSTNAGTYVAFIGLGVVAVVVVGWTAKELRKVQRVIHYVIGYGTGITVALLIWAIFLPSYRLHLHHAIIGAMVLPLARFNAIPSVILAAVGFGLCIQGYAAFGWDSLYVSIPTRLTLPVLEAPVISSITSSSASVTWRNNSTEALTAYSLDLNGVEVYRGANTEFILSNLISNLTYFVTIGTVGDYGVNGLRSLVQNFTTSAVV